VGKEGYGQEGEREGKACIGPPPLFQILDTPLGGYGTRGNELMLPRDGGTLNRH
jgi:hypothetical protein